MLCIYILGCIREKIFELVIYDVGALERGFPGWKLTIPGLD